jgi:hypothetical protein
MPFWLQAIVIRWDVSARCKSWSVSRSGLASPAHVRPNSAAIPLESAFMTGQIKGMSSLSADQ